MILKIFLLFLRGKTEFGRRVQKIDRGRGNGDENRSEPTLSGNRRDPRLGRREPFRRVLAKEMGGGLVWGTSGGVKTREMPVTVRINAFDVGTAANGPAFIFHVAGGANRRLGVVEGAGKDKEGFADPKQDPHRQKDDFCFHESKLTPYGVNCNGPDLRRVLRIIRLFFPRERTAVPKTGPLLR